MPKEDHLNEILAPPFEITIKVTPEIHTDEIAGEPYSYLHFVIQSEDDILPHYMHWDARGVHYGPHTGPSWERIKSHWLVQYSYARQSIKKATVIMADLLCREAALAQYHDIEWAAFFEELRKYLYKLYPTFAQTFPAGPDDGSYSRQARARVDAVKLIAYYIVFMESRFRDAPTEFIEIVNDSADDGCVISFEVVRSAVLRHAERLARANNKLARRTLAKSLGWDRGTLTKYLKRDRKLWDDACTAHTQARAELPEN
jgi:hypothetical protein